MTSMDTWPAYAVPLSKRSWIVREVARAVGVPVTSGLAAHMDSLRREWKFLRCRSVADYVCAADFGDMTSPQAERNDR